MRNPLLSLILVGLIGCSETGQAVGEAMVDADNAKEGIIKLDNGNHYEAMVSMSEEDKACVREQCADATADEATIQECYKAKCRDGGEGAAEEAAPSPPSRHLAL